MLTAMHPCLNHCELFSNPEPRTHFAEELFRCSPGSRCETSVCFVDPFLCRCQRMSSLFFSRASSSANKQSAVTDKLTELRDHRIKALEQIQLRVSLDTCAPLHTAHRLLSGIEPAIYLTYELRSPSSPSCTIIHILFFLLTRTGSVRDYLGGGDSPVCDLPPPAVRDLGVRLARHYSLHTYRRSRKYGIQCHVPRSVHGCGHRLYSTPNRSSIFFMLNMHMSIDRGRARKFVHHASWS